MKKSFESVMKATKKMGGKNVMADGMMGIKKGKKKVKKGKGK